MQGSKDGLFLKWCGHKQARSACRRWHYSRTCPNATASLAVLENGKFIGVVLFGSGNTHIGKPFGLPNSDCRELVRVALTKHHTATSRILAVALRLFRQRYPAVKLLVSYADSEQGHHGGIYQATGWVYVGPVPSHTYEVNGKRIHGRSIYSLYGQGSQRVSWLRKHIDPNARRLVLMAKHKYLYPLTEAMRAQIAPLAKPYPKRAPIA